LKIEGFYKFLRFLLTGKTKGIEIGQICEILGKEEVLERLKEFKFEFGLIEGKKKQ